MPKSILAAGLASSVKSYENWDAESVRNAVAEQKKKMEAAGFNLESYFIDANNPSALDEFKDLLRSKRWDGVSIGFGVRGDSQLTPLFESLVNAVLELVSPPPKMIFAVGPDSLLERAQHAFPDA